jgi:flagellar motor switch/type III secretory pathway protein FliN
MAILPHLFPLPVEKELGDKEITINNIIEIRRGNVFSTLTL